MTTLVEPPSVPADAPVGVAAATAFALPLPVATLSADLMPDEIVVKRRLGYLKRRLVFVMVALVALVVLGDLLVRQQTSSAEDGLTAENNQISTLTRQVNGFNGMLVIQGETEAIRTQLVGVMGDDVSWSQLIGRLAEPAPSGLALTSIAAQVDDANSTAGAASDPTGIVLPDAVGTVTLIGSARSWAQVATYVHGLSSTKGFTAVNPSAVSRQSTGSSGSLTFTVTLDLTSATLSNRYTAADIEPRTASAGTAAPADSQAGVKATTTKSAASHSRSSANVIGNGTGRTATKTSATPHNRSTPHTTAHHHDTSGHRNSASGANGQGQYSQESS